MTAWIEWWHGPDYSPWDDWDVCGMPLAAMRNAEIFDMCLWVERMWTYQGHTLRQQAEWRAHLPRDGSARHALSTWALVRRLRGE